MAPDGYFSLHSHSHSLDIDDIPQTKKKQERLEDLFEDNSSQTSSHNEDAGLFEADMDFEYDLASSLVPTEDDLEERKTANKDKTDKPTQPKKAQGIQAELDQKLEEIQTRAEKAKNKGKDAQKIEKKKESLKAFVIFQTLIMRNPQHYDNFMKLYTICLFARWHFFTKVCYSTHILGLCLSKLDPKDMAQLDKIKAQYSEDVCDNIKDRLVSIMGILLRNFAYEKFNDHHLLVNFAENDTYSYENLIQIFFSLLQYVGIPARIVSALDLFCLNVSFSIS